jgi:hypothetical protein
MAHIPKTIPIIAVTQAILSAGIWQLWETVQRRPVATIVIAFLYECGVFLLALGQKIWRELEGDVVTASVRWIRGIASSFAPGFVRRYKRQVVLDHSIFNVRGLGMLNTYSLRLEQVFVDLRIDPSNPEKLNFDPIARNTLGGNRPIWDFLKSDSDALTSKALAIIGAPGCGKTTLLQHVALTFASNKHSQYQIGPYVPILLFLRNHAQRIAREKPNLESLLQSYFSNPEQFPTLKPPTNWFAKQLKRGKCIVLLDGLDEIADEGQRKVVSRWVDDQIRTYPNSIFMLTARPQGYRNAPLFNAHILEVQPFNAAQVQRFVNNWFLANEIMSSGNKDDLRVRRTASLAAKDLLERLRNKSSLHDLTANPLLLTMITMVHRYRGALPGTRVELYSEICEVLLGRWRQTIGLRDRMQSAQKLLILRPLASHMMTMKQRDIESRTALHIIAPILETINVKGIRPETFLNDLQAGSGLFLEREAGYWSFAHLTFQEYLTASHWLEERQTDIPWHELVPDSWWGETLRWYAAQGDATEMVQACLEINSTTSLTLAAECLDEARSMDPKVLEKAEEILISGVESTTQSRRSLASEVHLRRRLKKLQRIENDLVDHLLEIDLEYITCAEYQLFLDDCRGNGLYRQPDHWSSFTFPPGEAFTPVKGIRASDAIDFCEWLSSHLGGGIKIRLPQIDEANRYAAVEKRLAPWCKDRDNVSLARQLGFLEEFRSSSDYIDDASLSKLRPYISESGGSTLCYIEDVFNEVCELHFVRQLIKSLANRLNVSLGNLNSTQLQRLLSLLSQRELINDLGRIGSIKNYFFQDYRVEVYYSETIAPLEGEFNNLSRTLTEASTFCSSLSAAFKDAYRVGNTATKLRDVHNIKNFIRELSTARNSGGNLIRALADARSQMLALDSNFISVIAVDINLACAILSDHETFSFIQEFEQKIQGAVDRGDIAAAVKLMETFFSRTKVFHEECLSLVNQILTAVQSSSLSEAQLRHKRFLATILKYAHPYGDEEGVDESLLSKVLGKRFEKRRNPLSGFQLTAVKLCAFLEITIAREQQRSAAWEAIRIVRERV